MARNIDNDEGEKLYCIVGVRTVNGEVSPHFSQVREEGKYMPVIPVLPKRVGERAAGAGKTTMEFWYTPNDMTKSDCLRWLLTQRDATELPGVRTFLEDQIRQVTEEEQKIADRAAKAESRQAEKAERAISPKATSGKRSNKKLMKTIEELEAAAGDSA